jgi:23S rRNA pseudouridine1911/1915/1917 synthase
VDNHLLVLYKPAGLLTQSDKTGEASLLELGKLWIKERYGKPGNVFLGLVHRLDRPVAGVIAFGRTSKAAGRLSEQFRSGSVRKTYLAVVEGTVKGNSGRLENHIERREDRSSRIVPDKTAWSKEARLSYTVLGRAKGRSLLEVHLETGRKHQIRAQMAHMGHPVLGDLRYGAAAPLPGKPVALMAWKLAIAHPTLKDERVFESPVPLGWPWPEPVGSVTSIPRPPWNWSDYGMDAGPEAGV